MKITNVARSVLFACMLLSLYASGYASVTAKNEVEQNHGFTANNANDLEWWNIPYPTRFDKSSLKAQSQLSINGNSLVDESGSVFILKGFNIADIAKLEHDKQWSKRLFQEIDQWGANVIRMPIHPYAWRLKGKEWHFERIDQAVRWANELGMYLIIDWHSIGNLKSEMYQHPMYATDMPESANFWRDMAFRYKGVPTMAVYEIFNEPTDDFIGNGKGSLGSVTWLEWRDLMEQLIDIVQVYDDTAISLVAGFNWAYDLSSVLESPIRRENVAYAIHPYPQKAKLKSETATNYKKIWQKQWGYVADKYPVMATELGWVREDGYGAHVPVIHNNGTYGPAIVDFMKSKNISWTAWVFDPDWSPVIIENWEFKPSEQGLFFKQILQRAE